MSLAHPADCMTARGVVRGTTPDGYAEVELFESAGCEGCAGACLWRRLDDTRRATIRLHSPTARRGVPVLVSLPQRYVLLSTLLLHGLPLAALLAGAAAGTLATGSDLGTLAGAAAGVALALASTPGLRRRMERATIRGLVLRPLPSSAPSPLP